MMHIGKDNQPHAMFDPRYAIRCPRCSRETTVTAVSLPRYENLVRFQPERLGLGFKCDYCLTPIFATFPTVKYDPGNNRISYDDDSPRFELQAVPPFEYGKLPTDVESAFREAALCYSVEAFNGFAAMCRRTVQAMANELGAKAKSRVKKQLKELREMGHVDDDTFTLLEEIIIGGHDGAHPNLPPVSRERAVILLELMKDILYQMYVRKAQLAEAAAERQAALKRTRGDATEPGAEVASS